MATITSFQLNELKREAYFQIQRLEREMQMSAKVSPGMEKSRRRFSMLLTLLKRLEQDGQLTLVSEQSVPTTKKKRCEDYAEGGDS